MRLPVELRLVNRDWRWYRDKYLSVLVAFSFVAAVGHVLNWPPTAWQIKWMGIWAVVGGCCLVLTPQRGLVAALGLGIIAMRGIVAFALRGSLMALGVGLVTSTLAIALLVIFRKHPIQYDVGEYSYPELGIDLVAFLSVLWFAIALT